LETKFTDTNARLKAGRTNARRVLDYLDDPFELYRRTSASQSTKFNVGNYSAASGRVTGVAS